MIFVSSIFVPVWVVMAAIWTDCEIIQPSTQQSAIAQWCPQAVLSDPTVGGHLFSKVLTNTKDTLAWVIVAMYIVYSVSAGVAWRREKSAVDRGEEVGFGMERLVCK